MKSKFFFLMVLFLGIGYISYAQSAADAPAAKQDETTKVTTTDQGKSGECQQTQTVSTTECKWVDANNDGICDVCGKKDCGNKSKAVTSSKCDPAACSSKSTAKPTGCCPSKDGKKNE